MPTVSEVSVNSAVAQVLVQLPGLIWKPLHKADGSPMPEFSVATPPREAGIILEHHHGDSVRLGYLHAQPRAAAFGSCLHWLVGSKDPIPPIVETRAPAMCAEISHNVPKLEANSLHHFVFRHFLSCTLDTFTCFTQKLAHTAQEHNTVCSGSVIGTDTARQSSSISLVSSKHQQPRPAYPASWHIHITYRI